MASRTRTTVFARTPVPIWDTEKRFPQFENSICLFQPGDRVKFVPVSEEEFDFVEAQVEDGRYRLGGEGLN